MSTHRDGTHGVRVLAILLVVACGDAPSDSAPAPAAVGPSDTSAEAITAYVTAGEHRRAPWVAQSAGPREPTDAVTPHGRVQVWMNPALVDSQAAGNGQLGGAPHPTGAMAVKELYDADDGLLGYAVMVKIAGASADWVYTCDGPAARCGTSTTPVWGVGIDTPCGFCHGGLVFNEL